MSLAEVKARVKTFTGSVGNTVPKTTGISIGNPATKEMAEGRGAGKRARSS